MTAWRTHTCGDLSLQELNREVTLMGWVHTVRDLGGVVFVDLRDQWGITQIVAEPPGPVFDTLARARSESVVQVRGTVRARKGGVNAKHPAGSIEVVAASAHVESMSEILPFSVAHPLLGESDDLRLTHRFLDLRTARMQHNLAVRSRLLQHIRVWLHGRGFTEFQTPILTSSSPEGARDFLVPSRLHPGKFYALPQAPQQFKQLLMCSGFDRYFQIAPCFRDEDARADRSPGEFYQLDMEMAFATEEEIFLLAEELMQNVFSSFSPVPYEKSPFPRIPYAVSLDTYGNDKPDLRWALPMTEVTGVFSQSPLEFLRLAGCIKALILPGGALCPRKFYDQEEQQARAHGLASLPWVTASPGGEWRGSLAKRLNDAEKASLLELFPALAAGDSAVLLAGPLREKVVRAGGKVRMDLIRSLGLPPRTPYAFAWITDFPFYEWNEEEARIDFCHNPFSMPKGGLAALETADPLTITAHQYDLVCNGLELCSGAIRNHRPDIMEKAFSVAGYSPDAVKERFRALWEAFQYGPPPHGGLAPGIERILMLLTGEANLREVTAFPLNQRGQDLLMGAPGTISQKQLGDVHIRLAEKPSMP